MNNIINDIDEYYNIIKNIKSEMYNTVNHITDLCKSGMLTHDEANLQKAVTVLTYSKALKKELKYIYLYHYRLIPDIEDRIAAVNETIKKCNEFIKNKMKENDND